MKKLTLFLIGLIILIFPLYASASIIDTVTLNEGYNHNDYGTFTFPNLGTRSVYDNYNVTISGGKTIKDGTYYDAFCVEDAWATGSNNSYTVLSIDGSLSTFVSNESDYFKAAWIAENYYDKNKEAAQIAIWEVMFETNSTYDINYNDPDRGVFFVDSGIDPTTLNNAASYLSDVMNMTFSPNFHSNWALAVNPEVSNNGTIKVESSQNYIFRAAAPTPEPATLLLFGTGLIGLGAFGRKRFFNRA